MRRFLASIFAALVSFVAIQPIASQASSPAMIIEVVISDLNADGTLSDSEKRAGVPLEGTVSVDVDWGDGTSPETFTTPGFKSHLYAAAGTYQISISGALSHWGFTSNAGDRDDGGGLGANSAASDEMAKITRVIQWGDLGLTKLEYGFSEAANLVEVPVDFPVLVTDAHALFIAATSFNDPRVLTWNVSGLRKFRSMFWGATIFNQPIGVWDTSGATDMSYMFNEAAAFNNSLALWDTSDVTDFQYMFSGAVSFNQPVGNFDLSSITNMANVLRLDSTAMGPENASLTLDAWAEVTQPTSLNLNFPRISRSGIQARNYLENTYGWNISTDINADIDVNIRPSRTYANGFSGLQAELNGPILHDVNLGARDDAFDNFGFVTLIDTDPSSPSDHIFRNSSFNTCSPKLDGETVPELGQNVHGHLFEITCQSIPVSIGGGIVELELKLEIEGSFARYTGKVLSTTAIRPLEFRFGGDLGSDSDALLEVLPGNRKVIAKESKDFDDPVITFNLNQPFSAIRSGRTTSDLNDLDGDDDLYFDFGSTTLTAGATLVELEMSFIDYHPQELSVNQAVEFARGILDSTESLFGMCLPVVRDDVVPELIDECITHPDKPTPINFANLDFNQEFVDVGEPSVAGEEFLFVNAATIGGQQINARVRIDSLAQMDSDELEDLDESGDDFQAEWHEWYLRVEALSSANASVETESRAELTIQFEDVQGNPYSINELFLNVYDVDDYQFVEFAAFQEFFLDSNTILNVREAPSGWTRFEELNGVSTSTSTADPRTISRVKVRYENVTQIQLALGQTSPNDYAHFFFDFSAGVGWASTANPTGVEPQSVTNFVDLPPVAVSTYTGPVVRSVTDAALRGTVTVSGERLNTVTAVEVDGVRIDVATPSATSFSFELPAGVTIGRKDLTLIGSFGRLVAQQAFIVSGTVGSLSNIAAWTQIQADGETVTIYAKGVVGAGKVQFLVNGVERAWIRAIDQSDPKLRRANGFDYLVRSIRLTAGKNTFEVYRDGERVWRSAYTQR